jgi:exosome complex component RRP40
VYCRISQAHSDMEPELECVNPSNGKSDGYGELKDGFMVQVNLKLSRDLLQSQHPLLTHLSKLFPFELAIGINGRIWINSETPDKIILIANVLQTADGGLPASKIPSMIKALKQKLYTDS